MYHDVVTPMRDLRSAFHYGIDRVVMVRHGLTKPKKSFFASLRKIATDCFPRYGSDVAGYMVLWTLAYDSGYYLRARGFV